MGGPGRSSSGPAFGRGPTDSLGMRQLYLRLGGAGHTEWPTIAQHSLCPVGLDLHSVFLVATQYQDTPRARIATDIEPDMTLSLGRIVAPPKYDQGTWAQLLGTQLLAPFFIGTGSRRCGMLDADGLETPGYE